MSRTTALQARWKALAPREQNLVLAAGGIVVPLWSGGWPWRPHWPRCARPLSCTASSTCNCSTCSACRQKHSNWQAQPQTSPSDAVGALRTALTQRLGTAAQMNVLGDRVTVTLKAAPADATAEWLACAPMRGP